MLKLVPFVALTLIITGCASSPPQVKYPTGVAVRIPVNKAPVGSPLLAVAPNAQGPVLVPNIVPAQELMPPQVAAEPPPQPLPFKLYTVNGDEQSVMFLVRRWARAAKVDFTWNGFIDYPITEKMKYIHATNIDDALTQLKVSLTGVSVPLAISYDGKVGVVVSPGVVMDETPSLVSITSNGKDVKAPEAISAPQPTNSSTTAPASPRAVWPVGNEINLRDLIARWASMSGVKLQWESNAEMRVNDDIRGGSYSGSFREALGQLGNNFKELQTPIGMKFVENGTVLRVYDIAQVTQ